MSYTTADLVKKHALAPQAINSQSANIELMLSAATWTTVSPGTIVSGTVKALAVTQLEPSSEPVTFEADTVVLSANPISLGSVAIADTTSLGTIYVEGLDYTVNYDTGSVTRVIGGAIASSANAQVWYFPYQQYTEGVDYEINYSQGSVKRLAGGNLQDGARILLSYDYTVNGIDDATYSEAANEANQMISAAVDPSGEFGADLNLQTAASFLAAALVCRTAATAALAGGARGSDASLWLDLALSFNTDSTKMLDQFKPPKKSLEPPRIV